MRRLAVVLGLGWLCVSSAVAQHNRPFPTGYGLGNLGTVLWADGPTGQQPWIAAAVQSDSLRWGVGIAGVDFYDEMDNFGDRDIRQAVVGLWWHVSRFSLKGAYECFSALSIYDEHHGFLSIGTDLVPRVNLSFELRGVWAGVRVFGDESETLAELGATAWMPGRHVGVLLAVEHLTVKEAAVDGLRVDPRVRFGFHTTRHRFGALGVTAELVCASEPYVRLALGQQYWFHELVGISAALATEPFMVAFGLTVEWRRGTVGVGIVHHPQLGWSKGFALGYAQ